MDVIRYRLFYRNGILIKLSGIRVKPGALFFCLMFYVASLFFVIGGIYHRRAGYWATIITD